MLLEKAGGVTRVRREWTGLTVVCMATGPSLCQEQVDMVRAAGLHAIATNDAYRIAPWADVVYWADAKWFAWHKDKPEFKQFAGQKCTILMQGAAGPTDPGYFALKNLGGDGLSIDSTGLMTGSNSGFQSIGIAALSGAQRIILLGYDCKRAPNGRKHFFGDHPDGSEPPYSNIRARFSSIVPVAAKLGIEIINATPGSWVECFKMMPLVEALARVQPVEGPALVS